jgi:hypothetical protein
LYIAGDVQPGGNGDVVKRFETDFIIDAQAVQYRFIAGAQGKAADAPVIVGSPGTDAGAAKTKGGMPFNRVGITVRYACTQKYTPAAIFIALNVLIAVIVKRSSVVIGLNGFVLGG